MTVLTPPGYTQGGTYTAKLDRVYIGTLGVVSNLGAAFSARQGFHQGRVPVYANPSGMNVTVGACSAVIANTFASSSGDYLMANDATVQVTLAASSPTQNRHDIVGFQVKDNIFDSSGLNSAIPAVIQGSNSAGTPSDPALPASFIPVVRAVVNAGVATPTLQSLITRTTCDGGLLSIADATERAAISPYESLFTYRRDRKQLELYDSQTSTWRVIGEAVASSLADLSSGVTSPYNGLHVYRTDTGLGYRYDSGQSAYFPDSILAARVVTAAGGFMDNITSEQDIAKLAVENYRVRSGHWYAFTVTIYGAFSLGTDTFAVRVRRDTPVSGTQMFVWEWDGGNGGDDTKTFFGLWQAPANDTDADFYVSLARVSGTGVMAVHGVGQTCIEVRPLGADSTLISSVA